MDTEQVRKALSKVIDPETGMDVLSMAMIKDIKLEENKVSLTFEPTLQDCPLAFKLASAIVEGIKGGIHRR